MRKFKVVLFSLLCVALIGVFGFEALAAVMLNINISGDVEYSATEIGAKIWGTYALNKNETDGEATYLALTGSGSSTENVYYIQGNEKSYSNITANIGTTTFTDKTDELELFVYIKNVGDRYIIPSINIVKTNESKYITTTSTTYFFDVSESSQIDPLTKKQSSASATEFTTAIKSEISNSNVSTFSSNSSIDNEDVYVARIVVALSDEVTGDGSLVINSAFTISISFMADVQYTSNDILSVYQEQNQSSSSWTKFGYNATLAASPTKIESNSLSNLAFYLDEADENGNTAYTLEDVYSESAPIYKDIDIVNVDIATGEIIGKLSDLNYDFEWYGREITLSAGTTLASGRTLTTDETFTVDVYTYYPTIYIRRWVVGNKQWISVSDKEFAGAVEIPEYYTATFEATIFNPDKTVARNSYGIITRSYVNDLVPLTSGSVNYLQTNYGYETYSGSTNSTTQAQMLAWASNMTKAWKSSSLASEYRTASGVQGENYTAQIYNLLYLVKYANNNTQAQVGYGNTYTYQLYYSSTSGTVTSSNGTEITTKSADANSRYESEKGGGTIGVYNSSSKGSGTYSQNANGEYVLSSSGFNNAGMNYGYNSTYTYGNDKQGLYANQFLTYNNGSKKYLCDGYVGSDKYTSVFCLGLCNSWGNIWTWVFGQAVISDGTNLFAYINFDDYDYSSSNWYTNSNGSGYDYNNNLLTSKNYYQLSYNLPTSNNYYRYLGTSISTSGTGLESLIGLQTKSSSTAGDSSGLCDYYYCNNSTSYVFGVLRGGSTYYDPYAGAFYFGVGSSLTSVNTHVGFRSSLIS